MAAPFFLLGFLLAALLSSLSLVLPFLSPVPLLHVVVTNGLDFGDIDVIYMVSFYIADHSVNC